MGKADYGLKSTEKGNVKYRRSLYFVKDLKVGDIITADAVRSVRPGYGLAPKYITDVVGSKATKPIHKNTPVKIESFKR